MTQDYTKQDNTRDTAHINYNVCPVIAVWSNDKQHLLIIELMKA